MYTVFRVCTEVCNETFEDFKKAFQNVSPNLLRDTKYETNLSCSVCEGQDWLEHRHKMIEFIERHRDVCSDYCKKGVSFSFDMAVSHEDFETYIIRTFSLDFELMSLLLDSKILFDFSVYHTSDDSDDGLDDSDGKI